MAQSNLASKSKAKETKTKDDEQVTIFGEKFSDQEWGKSDAGSGVWGVILIFGGLLLLANVLGFLSWDFWQHVWQFWPMLLVLLGVHILLGNNIFALIVLTILAIIIFGLITIWALEQINSDLVRYLPNDIRNFVDYLEGLRQ